MARTTWSAILFVVLIILVCVAGISSAQKASVPRHQDKLVLASDKVKDLLILMDTDKNGKISKHEWMKFMGAEFDRLDPEKTGEIDREEILRSTLAPRHPRPSDTGR